MKEALAGALSLTIEEGQKICVPLNYSSLEFNLKVTCSSETSAQITAYLPKDTACTIPLPAIFTFEKGKCVDIGAGTVETGYHIMCDGDQPGPPSPGPDPGNDPNDSNGATNLTITLVAAIFVVLSSFY